MAESGRLIADTPVTLPPGCPMLWTNPALTGSPVAAMMTGMVVVNFFADSASGVHIATMMSTLSRTSPSMMASSLAPLPPASM